MIVDSVLELIGHTPMLRVRRLDTGVCELFLKMDLANPGGSIKNRASDGLIRLSVGVEDIGDLKAELATALG